MSIGSTTWVIADGFIPPNSTGPAPDLLSHDSACILNAGDRDAQVEIFIYFVDREPVGPYRLTVAACRAHHQRINDLEGPEPVPIGVDYCCLIRSDVPIVVQHTRLDSRQAANALMSTIAYPVQVQ
jgi:hypothetical protein